MRFKDLRDEGLLHFVSIVGLLERKTFPRKIEKYVSLDRRETELWRRSKIQVPE